MVQRKKNYLSSEKWMEIRNAYVQGQENAQGQRIYPTIEQLAKSYDIHWNTIHRRSKSENWKDEREIFEAKMLKDIDSKKRKQMIDQSVQFDFDSLRLARSLQATIANVLTIDNEKAQQLKMRQNLDEKEQKNLKPIHLLKGAEINSLAMALEKAQKVGRLAFGESTENATITTSEQSSAKELADAYTEIQKLFSPTKSRTQSVH